MFVLAAATALLPLCWGETQAGQLDYTAWHDLGIIYSAPDGDAYYPCVIYQERQGRLGMRTYRMWYSDGEGQAYMTTSRNGLVWRPARETTGFPSPAHHLQVVYDPRGFGTWWGPRYKMWYWNMEANLYTVEAIAYAESWNGIHWIHHQPISQTGTALVTGAPGDWNRGSYGPIDVIYQHHAANRGDDPWKYRYVMYYDGTNGSNEHTGLAYSADGIQWTAYPDNPLLAGSPEASWDCSDNAYGTVYRDRAGYHFWYSGGGGDDGEGGCPSGSVHEGIGYAYSEDGLSWVKEPDPVFHTTDNEEHRSTRVYTPSVVNDGRKSLKMYYSAQGTGSKQIGLAVLFQTPPRSGKNLISPPQYDAPHLRGKRRH
jgi:hypothetical protein